ncbi:MAG: PadR family transcriptional regulator [Oligoflexia bacterium]|nr:PadR family transcriptional regulator [Oligoflexia bacterium]
MVLALLTERPMHGYECSREIVRREVDDWAGISRAQVYYSFKKILARGWARPAADPAKPAGPERQVLRVTKAGEAAVRRALAAPAWSTQRERPAFLTWLALSHLMSQGSRVAAVERRRGFLQAEIAKEEETLKAIRGDSGPMLAAAKLMVELTLQKFQIELKWLGDVEARLVKQAIS